MRAFVLAAGLGTRLRPLTNLLPKPMVAVADMPLVERAIRQLAAAGIHEIGVNVFHQPEPIMAWLGDGSRCGVTLQFFDERNALPGEPAGRREPLGTGGGLKAAESWLRAGGDRFLLVNGDVWHSFDLASICARHHSASLATMAVLGEEFCLLREHARWRAAGGGTGDDHGIASHLPAPPPLPPALEAVVRGGDANGANGASSEGAEALLERMEECHVLLLHGLHALRRHVSHRHSWVSSSGRNVGGETIGGVSMITPGARALLSPTLGAFLHPRFPFRARLRRRALRLVAAAATSTSLASSAATAAGDADAKAAAKAAASALCEHVWPSLSALLEVDHPARRAAGVTAAESERGAISTSTSTGCARYVI